MINGLRGQRSLLHLSSRACWRQPAALSDKNWWWKKHLKKSSTRFLLFSLSAVTCWWDNDSCWRKSTSVDHGWSFLWKWHWWKLTTLTQVLYLHTSYMLYLYYMLNLYSTTIWREILYFLHNNINLKGTFKVKMQN